MMASNVESSTSTILQDTPVFIWAPSTRCGTTLLQRLITSSRDLLVFGEDLYFLERIPRYLTKLNQQEDHARESLERFLNGEYNFWSPNVFPDLDAYSRLIVEHFYELAGLYRRTAREGDFDGWGLKAPKFLPNSYELFKSLLPRARHVVIHRHVVDVLKSQKGRGWIDTEDRLRENARGWNDGVRELEDRLRGSENAYFVSYDQLIENKHAGVRDLEAFLGISGIDLEVFDVRVNTFQGSEEGRSPEQYVEPKSLDDREHEIALEEAREALEVLGYE